MTRKNFDVRQQVTQPALVEKFLDELIGDVPVDAEHFEKRKRTFAAANGGTTILTRDVVAVAHRRRDTLPEKLEKLLQKRAVRTISGVTPIGILTKPWPCPGRCVYCPTEARMPKSYLSSQPAAARALRNKFHPFRQVQNRIAALEDSGHPVSKLEVIVMGGTWSALTPRYQSWFVKNIFDAANQSATTRKNKILILTGPGGAGKTTISELLKKERNFYWIDGDKIDSNFFPNGKQWGFENSEKLARAHDAILAEAKKQFVAGKNVVVDYIIFGRYFEFFEKFKAEFGENLEIRVLLPNKKTMIFRDKNRECWTTGEKRISEVRAEFLNIKNKIGAENFIDTTNETPAETFEKHFQKTFFQNFKPKIDEKKYLGKIEKVFGAKNSLKNLQIENETSARRVIGLTLETRPDWITEAELVRMRKFGCTRIEIGVQTLDDDVQKITRRGHGRAEVVRAMRLMRDFGFKICWHLMPGLPGSSPEKDLKMMREVWENPDFRPDFVKIYPCQVLPNSELERWWRDGKFEPLRDANLVPLLLEWKKSVPEYARVMRLMRDIPVGDVLDGVKFSNLRQILKTQPEKVRELLAASDVPNFDLPKKWPCRCIRCREVGFSKKTTGAPELVRRTYAASGGTEEFLSFESPDRQTIFALLRLRRPSGTKFSKMGSVLHDAALVREVHAYGTEISVGENAGRGQHRGLGKKLLAEAERIARDEWNFSKITVIAGVGTREYYRKFGYELRATYLTKKLR